MILTQEEAESLARQALAANDPGKAEALARAMLGDGRNGSATAWILLAQALRHQGRLSKTKQILEMLVDHFPADMDLRFDLSEILLQLGEFERGWREYHYRYNLSHTVALERKIQKPRWDGRPLPGKTLLIHDEQGLGDTFQFIRLASWAKRRSGARVVFQVAKEQEGFARRMPQLDQVILREELPPPFDMHCELMGLPLAVGLKLDDLPGPIPYLAPDESRLHKWRRKLRKLPRPVVALNWAGRPTLYHGQDRSTTLETLAALAMPGVTFVSVQKGPPAEQAKAPPAGMLLIDCGPEIADFDDTAAIFSLVDLVISIDSAPAHLAGGMNRPTWVMLCRIADWRWLQDRDDSPWYPSMRLFRQETPNDWSAVVERLAGRLRRLRDDGRP